MNNKFPSHSRLKRKADFEALRSRAFRVQSKFFRVFYKINEKALPSSRLAISVSSKSGNAVMRNLVKRIIRERFRTSNLKTKNIDCLVSFDKFKKVSQFSEELAKDADFLLQNLENENNLHSAH